MLIAKNVYDTSIFKQEIFREYTNTQKN